MDEQLIPTEKPEAPPAPIVLKRLNMKGYRQWFAEQYHEENLDFDAATNDQPDVVDVEWHGDTEYSGEPYCWCNFNRTEALVPKRFFVEPADA